MVEQANHIKNNFKRGLTPHESSLTTFSFYLTCRVVLWFITLRLPYAMDYFTDVQTRLRCTTRTQMTYRPQSSLHNWTGLQISPPVS